MNRVKSDLLSQSSPISLTFVIEMEMIIISNIIQSERDVCLITNAICCLLFVLLIYAVIEKSSSLFCCLYHLKNTKEKDCARRR